MLLADDIEGTGELEPLTPSDASRLSFFRCLSFLSFLSPRPFALFGFLAGTDAPKPHALDSDAKACS